MANLKCTGLNCPVQYTYADPKTCAEPEKCPYATFPRTNADRIREMTDEELAEKASRMSFCSGCPVQSSGIHFSLKHTPPEKVVSRWRERACAAVFFMRFWLANAERIAIENPVGFMNTAYRSADQTIHPYMFAESVDDKEQYVTKATCLWLKNLPKLKTNGLPKPDNGKLFGKLPSGKNRTWEDTYSRSGKVRSKTSPGIAAAMAEQWG